MLLQAVPWSFLYTVSILDPALGYYPGRFLTHETLAWLQVLHKTIPTELLGSMGVPEIVPSTEDQR